MGASDQDTDFGNAYDTADGGHKGEPRAFGGAVPDWTVCGDGLKLSASGKRRLWFCIPGIQPGWDYPPGGS